MSNLLSPLRRAASCFPDHVAVIDGEVSYTYAQTWDRCRRLLGVLHGLGLERGDRVAIAAANSHRYLELYQTIAGAGLVMVPLNTRHALAELRYALDDSGTKVLFTDLSVPDDLVERIVDVGAEDESSIAGTEPVDFPDDVAEADLAGLFYTGGTTGAAKGVMLTHGNLMANTFHVMTMIPFSPATRWLVCSPLFHAAGSFAICSTVYHGGTQVVLPAFHPGAFLDLVERHGVTHSLAVPTMLAAIADEQQARPRDTGSMRYLTHGASPIATEVVRRSTVAFPNATLMHLYGATETAPLATALVDEQLEIDGPRARSCGRPVPGVEISIRDGERVCADGEVGEVCIRGANIMQGYWNKPAETAAALPGGGWYRSGDLGYVAHDGCLFLVDRLKDMIVSGAENVYSTEVEEVLSQHPGVLECAVFGVPDDRWGEAVYAAVVPRSPEVTPEALAAHCRERISGYKVPKTIEIRSEPLPKSGAGKILKRELRDPFWSGRSERIN